MLALALGLRSYGLGRCFDLLNLRQSSSFIGSRLASTDTWSEGSPCDLIGDSEAIFIAERAFLTCGAKNEQTIPRQKNPFQNQLRVDVCTYGLPLSALALVQGKPSLEARTCSAFIRKIIEVQQIHRIVEVSASTRRGGARANAYVTKSRNAKKIIISDIYMYTGT